MQKVHLQMEFAVPTVAGKACLRGRSVAAALDRKQVTRKQHAALQFLRTAVTALGDVDETTLFPEQRPMTACCLQRLRILGRLFCLPIL